RERIDDDGNNGRERERAYDHILGAIQKNAHRKTVFGFRLERDLSGAATARPVIVTCQLPRHFSSPGWLAPMGRDAPEERASRYYLEVARPVASTAAPP